MKKSIKNFETNVSIQKQAMKQIIGGVNGKGHNNSRPKDKNPNYGHVTILK